MIAHVLLAAALLVRPGPDVAVTVTRGGHSLTLNLFVLTPRGSLRARQAALVGDRKPAGDGSGLLDGLLPDGRLLRVETAPPSPHAEPLTRALFDALDGDGDGGIRPGEFVAAGQRWLERFDADGDGCLTPLEIVPDLLTRAPPPGATPRVGAKVLGDVFATGLGAPPSVWRTGGLPTTGTSITYLGGQAYRISIDDRPANPVERPATPRALLRPGREAGRARYEAVAREVATLTLRAQPPGWFQLIDSDGDGQLSPCELRSTRFDTLDFESLHRGTLVMPDFVGGASASVSLSPGVAARPPVRLTKAPPPQLGPTWFRALNRNGDGDLARREFVGDLKRFQFYDADGDGLISAAEAEAGDRKLKAKDSP